MLTKSHHTCQRNTKHVVFTCYFRILSDTGRPNRASNETTGCVCLMSQKGDCHLGNYLANLINAIPLTEVIGANLIVYILKTHLNTHNNHNFSCTFFSFQMVLALLCHLCWLEQSSFGLVPESVIPIMADCNIRHFNRCTEH